MNPVDWAREHPMDAMLLLIGVSLLLNAIALTAAIQLLQLLDGVHRRLRALDGEVED